MADAAQTAALRKTCADAMNADPAFANDIVKTINLQTAELHIKAADKVAQNEQHVIGAYAAMWIAAVIFLVFLWRRQQGLKTHIAKLEKDLDAALTEAKDAK